MKNLQIRNVPDEIHRRLKIRAAEQGRSLSDLALDELRRSLERPTREELLARIARRRAVRPSRSAAELVRIERDSR